MPNILLIVVDALRADQVGFCAGKDLGTTNLDKLAADGVTFRNAISQASCTRPSVPSLMTGFYPSQHGVVDAIKGVKKGTVSVAALDHSIPTMAEILAGDGYVTAAFLGGNANLKPTFGLTRGFADVHWYPTNDGAALVEDFEKWIQAERPDRSLCYFHFMDVHNPLPMETIPSRLDRGLDLGLVKESLNDLQGHYAASVRRVDEHVARVVRALESAGILEDTWIILTADHGEELMEHGAMLAHGRTLYRELVHVPLAMKLPGRAFAARTIDSPVQHVDLLPTMLDYLGHPHRHLPGRSLLPILRGQETGSAAHAFSELYRRDRYIQSVTTTNHQFIQTYVLEELTGASARDLRPGLFVEVKGQPIKGGRFLATKVAMKSDQVFKVRGTVERVDVAKGLLTSMSHDFQIDETTKFVCLGDKPFGVRDLTRGMKISLTFGNGAKGPIVAQVIKQRKAGGKSKIEGVIQRVEDPESGLRRFTLLGIDVTVSDDVKVTPVREKRSRKGPRASGPSRVLTGDFLDTHRELYDVTADPAELRNIIDERPDIAQELEGTLAEWSQALAGNIRTAVGSVDVDPETLDQLRRMGYIE